MDVSVDNKDDKDNAEDTGTVVGVRFKPCGKIYSFRSTGLELKAGDKVVVESMFGLTIGTVVREMPAEDLADKAAGESKEEGAGRARSGSAKELKPVIRKATEEDIRTTEANRSLEEEARRHCLERIVARGLPMKLVCTEATLDRKRIIFYFTADGRIDFRELVKDLASRFRTRIEMRQIGVRDEAKQIGGMGVCGREFCCRTFLTNFAPISIRMAKEQNLILNAAKLSGVCGRLMCCLGYEHGVPPDAAESDEVDEVVPEEMVDGILCGDGSADEFLSVLSEGETAPEGAEKRKEDAGPQRSKGAKGGRGTARDRRRSRRDREKAGRPEKGTAEPAEQRNARGPAESPAGLPAKDGGVKAGAAEGPKEKKGGSRKKRPFFRHKNKKRRKQK